jgi:hypothetical protein
VPEVDATAVATITKGVSGYYGPDKYYDLDLTLLSVDVDRYEPDEIRPKPINDREPQEHNFYPEDDKDFVKFPVKSTNGGERWYGVFTSDLALSVDTAVTVTMGSHTWYNDDYDWGSGNFASTVCFSVTTSGVPTVTITNLDQFGPTKSYTITVVEEPFIAVEPESLTFIATQGGDLPEQQTINVTIPGGGHLFWTASLTYTGVITDWLSITPSYESKTPSVMIVKVNENFRNLPVCFHEASITIKPSRAPCDDSRERIVPVLLDVREPRTLADPSHHLQMMYERTGIFLPL